MESQFQNQRPGKLLILFTIMIVKMIIYYFQVFHRIGSLLPPEEVHPKFLQVYFLDCFAEDAARGVQGLNKQTIRNITSWFHLNNHYVRELKTAKEIIQESNIEERKIVIREDRRPQGEHLRRYNVQTAA